MATHPKTPNMRAKRLHTLPYIIAFSCSFGVGASAQPESRGCFAGINAGFAVLDESFSVNDGDVELLFEPSDDGAAIGVNLGCHLNDNWFVTGEYQHMDADEIEVDNWLASVNYGWDITEKGMLYLGAVAGWSILEWQKAPVDTSEQEPESEQSALGFQAGYAHDFSEHWRLNLRYLYLATDHETSLRPTSGNAKYKHDSLQGLTLGIDWRF